MALSHSHNRNPEGAATGQPGGAREPIGRLSINPVEGELTGLTSDGVASSLPIDAKLHTEIRRRMRNLAIAVRNGERGAPEDG